MIYTKYVFKYICVPGIKVFIYICNHYIIGTQLASCFVKFFYLWSNTTSYEKFLWCCFALIWPHLCLLKELNWVNAFWQREHWYGFCPVWSCLRLCTVKALDVVNDIWQNGHWNGFSPLWVSLWVVKLPDVLNALLQRMHWNGLSPLWIRLCLINWEELWNSFWHKSHRSKFPPAFMFYLNQIQLLNQR